MRVDGAVGEDLALLHLVASGDDDVLTMRDEVLFFATDGVGDDETLLATDGRLKADRAVDLGDLGGVLRRAGLEELGDARQTSGDVLRLGGLAGDLGDDGAAADLVAFVHFDASAGRD